jgi:uncharacterized protein DUF3606
MSDGKKKNRAHCHRKRINNEPYQVSYFASKHDISREQARELIRQIGNDREKLNLAAAKLFR